VAIAGAIALQTLFLGISALYEDRVRPLPATGPYQQSVTFPGGAPTADALADRLAHTAGVKATAAYTGMFLESDAVKSWQLPRVRIASCAVLRGFATLPDCKDGDAFTVQGPTERPDADPVAPGTIVRPAYFRGTGEPAAFPLPAVTAAVPPVEDADPNGRIGGGLLLLTPAAVPAEVLRGQPATVLVSLADGLADPREQLTTAVMAIDPQARTEFPLDPSPDSTYLAVKRLLTAGSALTLLLVSLSLLVGQLERFREQRRVLGVLNAVGTRRRVLGLSVLWQTLVPMALGLALAAVGGLLTGAALQYSAGLPFSADWGSMLAMTAIAAGAVLLTTVLGLP
ncbi:ABC transporter permease, partial [Kitasatospora sp. NPDC004799]|uniref:ABC transporter permease n=1 Tax=Kitasatospora sp. NPDC004799 TaxID=3154460 RepID=UPI00339DC42B